MWKAIKEILLKKACFHEWELVKEESSAINSSQEKLFLTAMQGWQCPICKRVYSPFTQMCMYCGNKEVETITLPNTVGLPQEQKGDFKNQTLI